MKDPDGEGLGEEAEELGEDANDVVEDANEVAGLAGLSLASPAPVPPDLTSVGLACSADVGDIAGAADAVGASTGWSLTSSARRALTAVASDASARLTLAPLACAADLGLADTADLGLVTATPAEEADALAGPVVTAAFGCVVAAACVAPS